MGDYRWVYDSHTSMSYRWRARVVPYTNWRGKPRWRVTFDQHFIGWEPHCRREDRRGFTTEAAAEAYANSVLDYIESGGHLGRLVDGG